jgi:hypothetical protein
MQTKNNVPAAAAPAATPAATVTAAPTGPVYRALPRNAVSATAKWQLGKPCFARAVQTQAAYAAVQAAIAAGNNTSAALHTACNTCTPADPTWLGYAIKAGWLVAAK